MPDMKNRQKTVTSQAICSAAAPIKRLECQQADEWGFQADERGLCMWFQRISGVVGPFFQESKSFGDDFSS